MLVTRTPVLRAVRPPSDPRTGSLRGRCTGGTVDGRDLPDSAAEDGAGPGRGTGTRTELTVTVDSWRWAGVSFRLRTGEALGTGRQEADLDGSGAPSGLERHPLGPFLAAWRAGDVPCCTTRRGRTVPSRRGGGSGQRRSGPLCRSAAGPVRPACRDHAVSPGGRPVSDPRSPSSDPGGSPS
nr:hypothetical protein [Geodermatophilus dictyosporus]